eukprot:11228306-Lingulodinium_polyedra.AAC.1
MRRSTSLVTESLPAAAGTSWASSWASPRCKAVLIASSSASESSEPGSSPMAKGHRGACTRARSRAAQRRRHLSQLQAARPRPQGDAHTRAAALGHHDLREALDHLRAHHTKGSHLNVVRAKESLCAAMQHSSRRVGIHHREERVRAKVVDLLQRHTQSPLHRVIVAGGIALNRIQHVEDTEERSGLEHGPEEAHDHALHLRHRQPRRGP